MTPVDWATLAGLIGLIGLSGSVSGSETAFFNLEPTQVEVFRNSPSRWQRLVAALLDRARDLLLTILILNNAINVAYLAIASSWGKILQERFPDSDIPLDITVNLASLSLLILVGEIFPKVLASSKSATLATIAALPLRLAMLACTPLTSIVARLLGRLAAEPATGDGTQVSGEELKLVIEQTRDHGVVSELVHDRLSEVIDLSETTAAAVMTHRVDCCQIDHSDKRQAAIEALRKKPGPFLLILDDQDECIGLLTAQDLLKGGRPAKRMRKPLYIPGNTNLAQVLQLFQRTRKYAGVVVDEYGGTLGLLTLPHLGNELLGPGRTVDLPNAPEPEQVADNRWLLPGNLSLEGWQPVLREEDIVGCTTIGGFVSKMLGTVPSVGDRLLYGNLLFQVQDLQGRRIGTVSVEKLAEDQARRMTQKGQR